MRRGLIFFGILLFLLIAVARVQAEPQRKKSPMATLSGVVIGPDDKPVAHAAVTYQSSSGSAAHAVHTDIHGRFSIPKLHADNYEIRASSKGVFSEWEKNVNVRPGQQKEITLRLIYARQMPKSGTAAKKKQ